MEPLHASLEVLAVCAFFLFWSAVITTNVLEE